MGKTLWKSQNVSLNGFFWGKHHPALAVTMKHESIVKLLQHVTSLMVCKMHLDLKIYCQAVNRVLYFRPATPVPTPVPTFIEEVTKGVVIHSNNKGFGSSIEYTGRLKAMFDKMIFHVSNILGGDDKVMEFRGKR